MIVNPAGGKGFAKRVWEETVKPIFELAGADFVVSFTGPPSSPTNASALARSHPSETYDALVALSGDGIVHELLNGLATHGTGRAREVLRQTPIVHVPCGSGNALATSLYGPEKVTDVRWAALTALKGLFDDFLFSSSLSFSFRLLLPLDRSTPCSLRSSSTRRHTPPLRPLLPHTTLDRLNSPHVLRLSSLRAHGRPRYVPYHSPSSHRPSSLIPC